MGVVVKQVELSWLDRTYVWPVLKGMAITGQHFIKQLFTSTSKRYTIQYPEMKKEMPEGYRGLHELKRFEDGAIKCVACFMCQEACPKDAIWLRNDYEVAAYDRLSMQYGKWDLMNTYAEADGKDRISQDLTPSVPRRTIAL